MTPRQFAPGDRLLIEATATDDTAARLNLGLRASVPFGPGDVVEASGADQLRSAAENFDQLAEEIGDQDASGASALQYAAGYCRDKALEAAALARPAHAPRVPDVLALSEPVAEWFATEMREFDPCAGYSWPEHTNDTGYRDGGYVKLQPSDVQAACRDNARRLLSLIRALIANQPAAPVVANDGAE